MSRREEIDEGVFEPRSDANVREFLVDFGASDNENAVGYTTNPKAIQQVLEANRINYQFGHAQQYFYTVGHINVTIYSFGVHRAMLLSLPDNPDEHTKKIFRDALQEAKALKPTEYHLLRNNCVTAVARVLNKLDPTVNTDVWLPWFQYSGLDSRFTSLSPAHLSHTVFPPTFYITTKAPALPRSRVIEREPPPYTNPTIKAFVAEYKGSYWRADNRINSVREIIDHAMGEHFGSGATTKATLSALKWVEKEPETGLLVAGPDAPADFLDALDEYYKQKHSKIIDCLKRWYREAGATAVDEKKMFSGIYEKTEIIRRLSEWTILKPDGPASRVYKRLTDLVVNPNTHFQLKQLLGEFTIDFKPDGMLSYSFDTNLFTIHEWQKKSILGDAELSARKGPSSDQTPESVNIFQLVRLLKSGRKAYDNVEVSVLDPENNDADAVQKYSLSRAFRNSVSDHIKDRLDLKGVTISQSVFDALLRNFATNFSGAVLPSDLDVSGRNLENANLSNTTLTGMRIDGDTNFTKVCAKNVTCDYFYFEDTKIESGKFIEAFLEAYRVPRTQSFDFFRGKDPLSAVLQGKEKGLGDKVVAILSVGYGESERSHAVRSALMVMREASHPSVRPESH